MRTSPKRGLQVAATMTTMALMAACAGGSGGTTPSASQPTLPQGGQQMKLDPADFTTKIDNKYLPLVPGTQLTYRGDDGEGETSVITITVTDETKKIANGITARVVRDTKRTQGKITEDTRDWFAQDSKGNVWYLGEDTLTFKDGKKDSAEGSFEAGVDGAMAGVAMPAKPRPGREYRQEYYKGHAEDNGEVLSSREMVDVTKGHFDSVLLTKDSSGIEPDVLEYKFYAPGVGTVFAIDVAGGHDTEELLSVKQVPAGTGTGPLGQP